MTFGLDARPTFRISCMPSFKSLTLSVVAATCVATQALAAPVTVDFGQAPTGFHANGTVIGGVGFANTGASSAFYIADYGVSSIGNGLETYDPGTPGQGGLLMSFSGPMKTLSFVFGNDDPSYVAPGSLAVLEVFLSGVSVASTSVVMNRDDAANQVIAYSGAAFDTALFFMGDASGESLSNFSEVVDNVTYSTVQEVPEPSTLAIASLGMWAVRFVRRRSLSVAEGGERDASI
jgi:hypothetical protein